MAAPFVLYNRKQHKYGKLGLYSLYGTRCLRTNIILMKNPQRAHNTLLAIDLDIIS